MSVVKSVISPGKVSRAGSTDLDGMPGGNGGGDGECKAEGGSMAQPALHGNLTAEQFNQPAHQGEPQPGALVMRCIEATEDVRQPFCLDAPAGVAHKKLYVVLLLLRLQQDGAILRRIAHRIA